MQRLTYMVLISLAQCHGGKRPCQPCVLSADDFVCTSLASRPMTVAFSLRRVYWLSDTIFTREYCIPYKIHQWIAQPHKMVCWWWPFFLYSNRKEIETADSSAFQMHIVLQWVRTPATLTTTKAECGVISKNVLRRNYISISTIISVCEEV